VRLVEMGIESYSKEVAIEVAQRMANQIKRPIYVLELEPGKFFPKTICHAIEKLTKKVVPNF
jgi:hypothetical protein